MKRILLKAIIFMFLSTTVGVAQIVHVKSPNGKIDIALESGAKISWSVKHENTEVIAPSTISLTLGDGVVLGNNAKIISAKNSKVNTTFATPIYKKESVVDEYNQVVVTFKGGFGLILRAYNDGVAYRFFINKKGKLLLNLKKLVLTLVRIIRAMFPTCGI